MLAYNEGNTCALENTASAPCGDVTEAFIEIVLSDRCMPKSYGWMKLKVGCREFPCVGGFPKLGIPRCIAPQPASAVTAEFRRSHVYSRTLTMANVGCQVLVKQTEIL